MGNQTISTKSREDSRKSKLTVEDLEREMQMFPTDFTEVGIEEKEPILQKKNIIPTTEAQKIPTKSVDKVGRVRTSFYLPSDLVDKLSFLGLVSRKSSSNIIRMLLEELFSKPSFSKLWKQYEDIHSIGDDLKISL